MIKDSFKTTQSDEYMANLLLKMGAGFQAKDSPFFEGGNKLLKPIHQMGVYNISGAVEENLHKQIPIDCTVPNCGKQFSTVFEYDLHFKSLHRFQCSQCKKNLPSAHLLDLHISENHDAFFAVQALKHQRVYACLVEGCATKTQNPEERLEHCITIHKMPSNFRYLEKSAINIKPSALANTSSSDVNTQDGQSSNAKDNSVTKLTNKTHQLHSFGLSQKKSFVTSGNYASALTGNSCNTRKQKGSRRKKQVLEDNRLVDDLMDVLMEDPIVVKNVNK